METCFVITGPTACGKSDLAMRLAVRLGGEIIGMDSMQIYRRMDIGTAKPTPEERAQVVHHMIDVVEPAENYTVAQYREDAEEAASRVLSRGHIPVFCGGTGFYLRALRMPMEMGGAPGSQAVRDELELAAGEEGGKERLHDALRAVDPASAGRIHVNDVRRVIRALEVYRVTGRPFSMQTNEKAVPPSFRYRVVCLTREREELYRRINLRVDRMMEQGLLEEVRGLLRSGVPREAQAMQGIGYKEFIPFVCGGGAALSDCVDSVKQNSRHYAKRQLTWMRREEDILWLDASDAAAEEKALAFLTGSEEQAV